MRNGIRPIANAWLLRGEVPGPDVDEFSDPWRITEALREQSGPTLLAVQHPHRTPDALEAGRGVSASVPAAAHALRVLQREHYVDATEVIAAYRINGADAQAWGILCLADPEAVDAQGRTWIQESERVYEHVVAERGEVLASLGVATSAAMLVPATECDVLSQVVARVAAELGPPGVISTDAQGRTHELWVVGPGARQRELLAAAGEHPLIVADGNHRVAAARAAGLGGLLTLITSGPHLRIRAIHRVLSGTGLGLDDLRAAWREFPISDVRAGAPTEQGSAVVTTRQGAIRVRLPGVDGDHREVEHLLLRDRLGIDPRGAHLHAWPEGAPAIAEGEVCISLAPIRFDQVLTAHAQGLRMHRKSTYFTPKPRSGLLLASLRA